MPPKLTIRKVLNIRSIMVIICYDRRLKLVRKFFKSGNRSKQRIFQYRDLTSDPLSNSNKWVFAHITKI